MNNRRQKEQGSHHAEWFLLYSAPRHIASIVDMFIAIALPTALLNRDPVSLFHTRASLQQMSQLKE